MKIKTFCYNCGQEIELNSAFISDYETYCIENCAAELQENLHNSVDSEPTK